MLEEHVRMLSLSTNCRVVDPGLLWRDMLSISFSGRVVQINMLCQVVVSRLSSYDYGLLHVA